MAVLAPIRPATRSDLPALHGLIERAYRGDSARGGWTHEADLLGGQRTDMTALEVVIAAPSETILIARAGDAAIGCVQVSDRGGGLAYLGLLAVEPAVQAGGLGRRLIAAAEAEARAIGADRVEMTVIRQRTELIAWYARRGYTPTGEVRPFPLDDPRFGLPKTRALAFVVLARAL